MKRFFIQNATGRPHTVEIVMDAGGVCAVSGLNFFLSREQREAIKNQSDLNKALAGEGVKVEDIDPSKFKPLEGVTEVTEKEAEAMANKIIDEHLKRSEARDAQLAEKYKDN